MDFSSLIDLSGMTRFENVRLSTGRQSAARNHLGMGETPMLRNTAPDRF
jgi:hypothetical protein